MAKLPEYFYFRVTPVTNKGVLERIMVEDASQTDVVEVVRCKDCVCYITIGCSDGFGWCENPQVSKGVYESFFCADGERRTDDD